MNFAANAAADMLVITSVLVLASLSDEAFVPRPVCGNLVGATLFTIDIGSAKRGDS